MQIPCQGIKKQIGTKEERTCRVPGIMNAAAVLVDVAPITQVVHSPADPKVTRSVSITPHNGQVRRKGRMLLLFSEGGSFSFNPILQIVSS